MIIWGTENLVPLNCRNLQKYNVYRDFTEKEQKTVIRGQTQQSRKTKVISEIMNQAIARCNYSYINSKFTLH